jgi:predicted permease
MRPPRLAAWLLAGRLRPEDRDEILGDLAEDFDERVGTRGETFARRWYWRHAIALAWSLGLHATVVDRPRDRLMVLDELRFSVRRLVRQPWATAASIATLACAIGAAVATSSLVSAALVHPIAVAEAARLAVITERSRTSRTWVGGRSSFELPYPALDAIRSSAIFDEVAGSGKWAEPVEIRGAPSDRRVLFVSAGFFHVIGRPLEVGREFSLADDQRGAPLAVVLSDALWRSSLGADRTAIGRPIVVHDRAATVIGVAPADFRGLELAYPPEVYLPLNVIGDLTPPQLDWFNEPGPANAYGPAKLPTGGWLRVVGRLRPGATEAQVGAALAALRGVRLAGSTLGVADGTFETADIETAALSDSARTDVTRFARLLAITVALLLTIGCLAVGTLLLVRSEGRRDELAVCVALGASRTRLAAGIVGEGGLLSIVGAAGAVPVSWWLLAGLHAFRLPGGVPMSVLQVQVDLGTFATAAGAAVLATAAMAVVAAGVGLSATVTEALRSRAGVTPAVSRRRTRRMLVIGEIAVSLVLLSGAGLFARSVQRALALDPAFDTSHLLMANMAIGTMGGGFTDHDFDELRDRLNANPAIRSASIEIPRGSAGPGSRMLIDGEVRTVTSDASEIGIDNRYLTTMGLKVVRGRTLTTAEASVDRPGALVSASFGRFVGRGEDPIGHHIGVLNWFGERPYNVEIVGVVQDLITDIHALTPQVLYLPARLFARWPNRLVVIHAAGDVAAVARETRATVTAIRPSTPPPVLATLKASVLAQMGPQEFGATVMGALGIMAAMLTLFGVFVVVESTTVLRRRELGVRAALGATSRQLGALVVREVLLMTTAGLATGLLFAWLAAGLIRTFLYQVSPFDVTTLGVTSISLVALTLAAGARPALAAGRVNLAEALREP